MMKFKFDLELLLKKHEIIFLKGDSENITNLRTNLMNMMGAFKNKIKIVGSPKGNKVRI